MRVALFLCAFFFRLFSIVVAVWSYSCLVLVFINRFHSRHVEDTAANSLLESTAHDDIASMVNLPPGLPLGYHILSFHSMSSLLVAGSSHPQQGHLPLGHKGTGRLRALQGVETGNILGCWVRKIASLLCARLLRVDW